MNKFRKKRSKTNQYHIARYFEPIPAKKIGFCPISQDMAKMIIQPKLDSILAAKHAKATISMYVDHRNRIDWFLSQMREDPCHHTHSISFAGRFITDLNNRRFYDQNTSTKAKKSSLWRLQPLGAGLQSDRYSTYKDDWTMSHPGTILPQSEECYNETTRTRRRITELWVC